MNFREKIISGATTAFIDSMNKSSVFSFERDEDKATKILSNR